MSDAPKRRPFLHEDSPVMALARIITDMVFINLLFLLTSLPIVTTGASLTAAYTAVRARSMDKRDKTLFSCYFHAFLANFSQATSLFLILLLCTVILGIDFWWSIQNLFTLFGPFMSIFSGVLLLLLWGSSLYLFQLLARYKNTNRQHIKNACVLAAMHPWNTIRLMLLRLAAMVLMAESVLQGWAAAFPLSLTCFGILFTLSGRWTEKAIDPAQTGGS